MPLSLLGTQRDSWHGLRLYADEDEDADFSVLWLEKVRRALALIEQTAPQTAARVRRDVRLISVSGVWGPDYEDVLRAIRLHGPALLWQDSTQVALTIVHEAMHARIARRGIPYADDQRERHERAATAAEVRFAKKLPGGEELVGPVLQKLQTPWWTDEALAERRLREFDLLKWHGRLARFFRRRIAADLARKRGAV